MKRKHLTIDVLILMTQSFFFLFSNFFFLKFPAIVEKLKKNCLIFMLLDCFKYCLENGRKLKEISMLFFSNPPFGPYQHEAINTFCVKSKQFFDDTNTNWSHGISHQNEYKSVLTVRNVLK